MGVPLMICTPATMRLKMAITTTNSQPLRIEIPELTRHREPDQGNDAGHE
jgi:hypothetical protein